MIKHINFTSNKIEKFILEVKNIIDNDFCLKKSNIVIAGILLIFDDIFDTENNFNRIALINENVITTLIPDEIFEVYKYHINYVPYESLYIRFIKK